MTYKYLAISYNGKLLGTDSREVVELYDEMDWAIYGPGFMIIDELADIEGEAEEEDED